MVAVPDEGVIGPLDGVTPEEPVIVYRPDVILLGAVPRKAMACRIALDEIVTGPVTAGEFVFGVVPSSV